MVLGGGGAGVAARRIEAVAPLALWIAVATLVARRRCSAT